VRGKRIGAQRVGRNASGRTKGRAPRRPAAIAEAAGMLESIDKDRIFTLDVDPCRRECSRPAGRSRASIHSSPPPHPRRTLMNRLNTLLIGAAVLFTAPAAADPEHYEIDTRGAHAFVQFRISHLGFSWLYGRFNDFEGEFTFDPESPEDSSVNVEIRTASVDSNHERRDDHLRGEDFLRVDEHPVASFRSTAFVPTGEDRYRLEGELSMLGLTREVSIDVVQTGAGEDPWGGFRRGFEGTTTLTLADWGIDYELGPEARTVDMTLTIEGIRKDSDA
jgi:polyisoprenoid-binding protein YceI